MSRAEQALNAAKRRVEEQRQQEADYAARVRADREAAAEEDRNSPLKLVLSPEENSTYQKLDEACARLNDDARDFVFVLYWLMSAAGYSEKSRSWIVAILAYIDRKDLHKDGPEITDAQLADFIGCSERTIQRRRSDYLREKHRKLEILSVIEGDYDTAMEQNRPTRYRFPCDVIVGDAVIEARSMKLWATDYREALKTAAFRAYESERQRLNGAIPHATRRRKKKVPSPESERERIRKTMLTLAASLREIEEKLPADFSADWEELKGKLDEAYRGDRRDDKNLTPPQPSDSKEDDPMGRQTVVPSISGGTLNNNKNIVPPEPPVPDLVIPADVPNDIEVMSRVPSAARAWRALNLEQIE
jgi:hypothetical protein